MTTYRILYIEHDRSRDDYMSAMQQAGATVEPVDYLDKEQLLREVDLKLHRGRYDAVITDAFFLRQGCDHEEDDARGDYLLPELVNCVRTIDNRRTRIVVMTHFPDPVLQDNTEALGVDDIWDKYSCPVDFVRWKVARMAQDAARHLPEHALLAAIADVVHKQEHPTANDKIMLDMIDRYQSRVGEREQILAIRPCIEAVANGLGKDMAQAIHSLFGTLIDMEPVNVAGSPSSWGHLRHVVNVWWLGWYFIRSGWIDGKWIAERAFPEKAKNADVEAIQLVENSWFVAAMFHDIGKLYEDMPKLIKDCNTFLGVYPMQCALPDLQAKIDDTAIKRFVTTLATAARCQQLVGIFTALQADAAAAVSDHGVLSAYTIYSRLGGKGMPEEALLAAAVAVATHNWIKKTAKLQWEKGQETDTKVPLARHPELRDGPLVHTTVHADDGLLLAELVAQRPGQLAQVLARQVMEVHVRDQIEVLADLEQFSPTEAAVTRLALAKPLWAKTRAWPRSWTGWRTSRGEPPKSISQFPGGRARKTVGRWFRRCPPASAMPGGQHGKGHLRRP